MTAAGTPIRTREAFTAAVLALLVCAIAAVAQNAPAQVEQVLRHASPQIKDELVLLGTPAVPALIEKLDTYAHPVVIIEALGRIGDPRATAPLLARLDRLQPFSQSEYEHSAERLMILAALRELGDRSAEPELHALLSSHTASLDTRLAAASGLAQWASPIVKQESAEFILRTAREYQPSADGVTSGILDDALAAVATDEARAVLADRLSTAPLSSEQLRILRLFARDPSSSLATPLLAFCERKDRDAYVRLQAAKVLAGSKLEFPRNRLTRLVNTLAAMLPPELRPEALALAKQLNP